MDAAQARAAALIAAAIQLPGSAPAALTGYAGQLAPWIGLGPLRITIDALTYQQSSSQAVKTISTGGNVQLTDTQQFTAHIHPEDSRGFDTTDASLAWTEDSNGAVVTLQPSDDGTSCVFVAVAPGTANYTVSDGTRQAAGVATVVAGDVAQLVLAEDAPVDQAPAAPPAS